MIEELQCPYCLKQIDSRRSDQCKRCGKHYTDRQVGELNGFSDAVLTKEERETLNWTMCWLMNKTYPDAYLKGETEFAKSCIKDRNIIRNLLERMG